MLPPPFRAPANQLRNRTATPGSKQQHSPSIRGSHFPELSPEALIIRISLRTALPRQPIHIIRPQFQALLSLKLQIELHSLLQTLALRVITLARSESTADPESDDDSDGCENKSEDVEERGIVEDRGVVEEERGEEEREGVEDVGEVGDDKEGS